MFANCHTYYSFKYGTMSPAELLDEAQEQGAALLALTDINSTSGCLYFAMEALKRGKRLVLGVDFRSGARQHFIALARNNLGFQHINTFLSEVLAKRKKLLDEAPSLPETLIIYPLNNAPNRKLLENEYVGVDHTQLFQLDQQKGPWQREHIVALNTVTFRNKRDFNAHRLLRAIDNNIILSRLTEKEQGQMHHRFYPLAELKERYASHPELLLRAQQLMEMCSLYFDFKNSANPQNKVSFTTSKDQDLKLLKYLVKVGLNYRYGDQVTDTIRERVKKELKVISDCNFVPYFLINHAIVKYAQSKGYFYVGRGSGANSLVAYLLKITNVDPIELNLYFERFINPSRKSPPDFDIDFSWRDRNDVTRFIFETFPNTALMGSFVTFQQRSVIREIGKVLGLPSDEIKTIQRSRDPSKLDHVSRLCVLYSQYIHGFPNHLSVHSSGIVITERPIAYFGATSLPPKGFPTAHFDMHIAEDAGIYKYDILAQRGLGKIKDAIAVIHQNQPDAPPFDIDDVARFKKDDKIKDLLRRGDAIGCFYVESPAMRALMKKLEVDDYTGLVAASSIIRPGVSNSGMMQEYIRRHKNPTARAAVHPVLGEILNDTYGVMVYQEDVLKVAHYFAGLTLEESDILRRGMSWKFRERTEFTQVKDRFFSNCEQRGYSDELTGQIWKQIESFANYAFAKGHSASYAVESYQSLFLKAHFPLEYMVATINNFGGFYRTEQYIQEARLKGAIIEAPCVNESAMITTIQGTIIYLGFQHVKDLDTEYTKRLIRERNNGGVFTSFRDFVLRTALPLEAIIILIRTNAFRCFGTPKGELLWKAHFMLNKSKQTVAHPALFPAATNTRTVQVPKLQPLPYEDAFDEIEYLGFPLCSPFELIDPEMLKHKMVSKLFPEYKGKIVTLVGYLIHTKRTKTKGKIEQEMAFGTFMDLDGILFDSVHFPKVLRQYPFRGKGCYLVRGTVGEDYGHFMLEASQLVRVPFDKIVQEPR